MIRYRTPLVLLLSTLALAAVALTIKGSSGFATVLLPAACIGFVVAVSHVLGWARATLSLLVIAALINRYVVSAAGLNLKAEHAAIGIGAVVLVWQVAARRQRLRVDKADVLLGMWVLANGLASINAPVPMSSLKLTLQLAILFAGYLLVQQFTRRRADLFLGHGLLLWGITLAGAFGVLVHLVYPLGLDLGMQINPVTKQPTVYGTLYEGNLFGSTIMIGLVWWLVLLIFGAARYRLISAVGLTLCTVALEVSLARGSWLAIAATVLLAAFAYFVFRRRLALSPLVRPRTLAVVAMSVLLLSTIVWVEPVTLAARAWDSISSAQPAPSSGAGGSGSSSSAPGGTDTGSPPAVIDRITSLSDAGQDLTVNQRLDTLKQAARDWTQHPIIGWGPGSYGQKYINTSYLPAWLGMLPLRLLHDTGIVGVLLFAAFGFVLLQSAVRALRTTIDRTLRIMLVAHLISVVALFIAYTITEGIQLFFPWLLLGLFGATIRAARSQQSSPA